MGHVHEEFGAHLVGDFAEAFEVDDARVGGSAGHDDLRMAFHGLLLHFIVIDAAGFLRDAVGLHMEETAGEVDRAAMGQMAAVVEVHAQDRVPRLAQRHIGRIIGLRAGVGLHIGKFCAKEFFCPLDGQILRDIHALAAAIVALAGIPFGIFIGEHRPHRRHHRFRDDVLRGDQLNIPLLSGVFQLNRLADLRVGLL